MIKKDLMRAAVISLNSESSRSLANEMKKFFNEVDHISLKDVEVTMANKNFEVLYKGEKLCKYDCVYARGSYRYASVLTSLTSALKDSTYMPLKPHSFTIGHDKFLTQLHFQHKKIPMPEAYIAATSAAAKKILKKINYPIMIKVPHGTHGKGVLYAESYASASSMCDALTVMNQPFIIQEYIETGGTDIRAVVAGGKVVASYKRKADLSESRANYHAGGTGEPYFLDAAEQKIAIEAAKAIGADVCAVDLVVCSTKGPLVIEVNLSPGLQGITRVLKQNVAEKVAKALYEKARAFKDRTQNGTYGQMIKELDESRLPQQEIISNLEFRGNRILLPKITTDLSGFKSEKEYLIKATKGKILIRDDM
ncbi:RimK family alpha-L-glutamate ligase [Candidatus Woesearchaeota archaeon]|nr:RimK family alpha-L-glutamate ligase [Candidatus Woesearchaeota archaeon]